MAMEDPGAVMNATVGIQRRSPLVDLIQMDARTVVINCVDVHIDAPPCTYSSRTVDGIRVTQLDTDREWPFGDRHVVDSCLNATSEGLPSTHAFPRGRHVAYSRRFTYVTSPCLATCVWAGRYRSVQRGLYSTCSRMFTRTQRRNCPGVRFMLRCYNDGRAWITPIRNGHGVARRVDAGPGSGCLPLSESGDSVSPEGDPLRSSSK